MGSNKVIQGVNDLETYCKQNGKEYLLREWHPTKNGDLKPSGVSFGSEKRIWWLLPYDDIKTGKHFDFEWEARVNTRVKGSGCPFISGHKAWEGYNDLETLFPQIAKEWHPTRNGNLKPSEVTIGCGKKVWWYLPYDDKETGKHFDFEWETWISERVQGGKCPYLSGQKVWKGYNDLETVCPNLAKEWHPTKNGNLKPSEVSKGSERKVWWLLPYDDKETGKHFDFEWQANISNRVKGNGCPYLCGYKAWKGYNDLETLYPDIAKEWHPTKNGKLKPSDVPYGSPKKVWWYITYFDNRMGKTFEFEWEDRIYHRVKGIGCPFLSGHKVYNGFNDLQTLYPEIAKEWHPTKNGSLKPNNITARTPKKIWWKCKLGHEWETTIANRTFGTNCPYCGGSKAERFLYDYCKKNDIAFVAEKKFQAPPIKFYPFDLYLYKSGLIIEADGIQHFMKLDYFASTDKDFEGRVKNDNVKNEYCLQQKIPILRIPYTYDAIKDKNQIESIIKEFIKTRKIPQEILDFYKPYKESIGSNYYDVASALNELV